MLRQRREAVANVTEAFRTAERAMEHAALSGARCIAAMLEERAKANLPVDTAADELQMIAEGVRNAVTAHVSFVKAHRGLRAVPEQIGLSARDISASGVNDCPPNSPRVPATLELVATSAVA